MKNALKNPLCLGLTIAGFLVGIAGVVVFFNSGVVLLFPLVTGWLLLLAGGLPLLITALREDNNKRKG